MIEKCVHVFESRITETENSGEWRVKRIERKMLMENNGDNNKNHLPLLLGVRPQKGNRFSMLF